jgi:anti-sigma factor RsiW
MTEAQLDHGVALDHEAALDLAALALDGPLPPPNEERLATHLAACQRCRATQEAMRRDARVLGQLARADAPPHVRAAVVRRVAAGAGDGRGSRPLDPLASGLHAGRALAFAIGAFLVTLLALALMVASAP